MAIAGFQTSTWMHECDDQGRVRRHMVSTALGHQGWGEWGHLVFMPRMNPADICGNKEDITLVSRGRDGSYEPLPFADSDEALKRPQGAIIGVLRQHQETGDTKFIPEIAMPLAKSIPIIMSFSPQEGTVVTTIGQPIMRVFSTRPEMQKILHPEPVSHPQGKLLVMPRPDGVTTSHFKMPG